MEKRLYLRVVALDFRRVTFSGTRTAGASIVVVVVVAIAVGAGVVVVVADVAAELLVEVLLALVAVPEEGVAAAVLAVVVAPALVAEA